uniref:CS domain-containing protein n=1 Tax=Elaeophora elaphi TaxID=1147741 RepID=A0A0R3S0A9_9BILA
MTNSTMATLHPLVQWAQRDKLLYLTIEIDDVADLQITEKSLHVKGTYGGSIAVYEATLDFYAGVKTDYRKIANDRHLELVINKEVPQWWPRLSKSNAKLPWVKIDFNKWKDEDEDEDDMNDVNLDFRDYMSKLDAGGAGAPNLDDFDDDDDKDEDDDDMPDLEDVDDKESLDGEEAKAGAATEEKKDKVEAGDKKQGVVEHS